MKNEMKRLKAAGMLLLATMIWGVSFVFQARGSVLAGPLTFNLLRCLIASCATGLMVRMYPDHTVLKKDNSLRAGILCGIMTFLTTALLQMGMAMGSSVGKAGFLASTTVIIVPVLNAVSGTRQSLQTWFSMAVTDMGMFLLCFSGDTGFAFSDLLILMSALAYAFQILILDHYRDSIRSVRVSFLQFGTAALLSILSVFLFERPASLSYLFGLMLQPEIILAVLYAGILASGLAYTLQIESQKVLEPAAVSLLLCFESVFSVLAGFIFLHEILTARELSGCGLIFLAAVMSQLPAEKLIRRLSGQHMIIKTRS